MAPSTLFFRVDVGMYSPVFDLRIAIGATLNPCKCVFFVFLFPFKRTEKTLCYKPDTGARKSSQGRARKWK